MRLELRDRRGVAEWREGYANVALVSGRPLRAPCIWGAAERLRPKLDHRCRLASDRAMRVGFEPRAQPLAM